MNKLLVRLKHKFRTSVLAAPYWRRRHAALKERGQFSQFGEDVAIREMFPDGSIYIDIGANHPFQISTTYLLYLEGWRGVTVEPIRSLWKLHRRWRPEDISLNAAVGTGATLPFFELYPDVLSTMSREDAEQIEANGKGFVLSTYEVPLITGQEIVDTHLNGKVVDLLSIDVEAFELPVLRSFDFSRFHPRAILIEESSFIPNAASSKACASFLRDAGYQLERRVGCNGIYVR
jgi:FkbM family methyltransferase